MIKPLIDILGRILPGLVATKTKDIQDVVVKSIKGLDKKEEENDPFPTKIDTDIEKILTPLLLKRELFIYTPLKNIETNLPLVLQALQNRGCLDKEFVCYAIATIFVENDKFCPMAESVSKWNTRKEPFDKYVGKLGNKTLSDAQKFRGASLIQLTGLNNYKHMDEVLKLDGGLLESGYIAANEIHLSAVIFATFLKEREEEIREAIKTPGFKDDRAVVNGKTALHWEKFEEAYEKLYKLLS